MSERKCIRKLLAVIVVFSMVVAGLAIGPVSYAKVKLNKKNVTVAVGSTVQLKLKGTKKKPKWSTSDDSIVDVNKKGKILGIHAGTAVVTAKLKKKKYHCVVTVKNADTGTDPTPNPGTTPAPATSQAPTDTAAPSTTAVPAATATPGTGGGSMPASYELTSADGKKMSVKPGFTSTIYHRDVKDASSNIKVRIPSLEGYSGSDFKLNSVVKDSNGAIKTTFEVYKYDEMSFLSNYVSALEDAGFTKKYSGKTIYTFEYDGSESISKGLVEFGGDNYDMDILYEKESGLSYIYIEHAPEVGFSGGETVRDYGTIETATDRSIGKTGRIDYKITGWGGAKNEVSISFSPEKYKEGDVITGADFKAQKNVGSSNALCWIYADSNMLKGDGIWSTVGAEDLRDAQVEIIKQTADYEIIHSLVTFCRGEVDYVIESLIYGTVSGTSSGGGGSGGGGGGGLFPQPTSTSIHVCPLCKGAKTTDCHTCGGDGFIPCPACNGRGSTTAYGQTVKCARCNGHREVVCDARGCVKGQVTCTYCGGRGTV